MGNTGNSHNFAKRAQPASKMILEWIRSFKGLGLKSGLESAFLSATFPGLDICVLRGMKDA
jgi:hypothetical protein